MPTGSNRTTCLSAMNSLADYVLHASDCDRPDVRRALAGKRATGRGLDGWARGPPSWLIRYRSGVSWREPSGRAAAHVARAEGLPLLGRPLVEQHVRALQRC